LATAEEGDERAFYGKIWRCKGFNLEVG